MTMLFIAAQILSAIGFVVNTASIQFKNKKNIIFGKAISNFIYAIQYLLLGSITAFLTGIVAGVRNVLFMNGTKKASIWTLIPFIIIAILIGIFTYTDLFSILPVIITMIQSYIAWQSKEKIIRYGSLIVCIMWLPYLIHIRGYVTFITTIITLISVIIAIVRYDIKKEKKKMHI